MRRVLTGSPGLLNVCHALDLLMLMPENRVDLDSEESRVWGVEHAEDTLQNMQNMQNMQHAEYANMQSIP